MFPSYRCVVCGVVLSTEPFGEAVCRACKATNIVRRVLVAFGFLAVLLMSSSVSAQQTTSVTEGSYCVAGARGYYCANLPRFTLRLSVGEYSIAELPSNNGIVSGPVPTGWVVGPVPTGWLVFLPQAEGKSWFITRGGEGFAKLRVFGNHYFIATENGTIAFGLLF